MPRLYGGMIGALMIGAIVALAPVEIEVGWVNGQAHLADDAEKAHQDWIDALGQAERNLRELTEAKSEHLTNPLPWPDIGSLMRAAHGQQPIDCEGTMALRTLHARLPGAPDFYESITLADEREPRWVLIHYPRSGVGTTPDWVWFLRAGADDAFTIHAQGPYTDEVAAQSPCVYLKGEPGPTPDTPVPGDRRI